MMEAVFMSAVADACKVYCCAGSMKPQGAGWKMPGCCSQTFKPADRQLLAQYAGAHIARVCPACLQ